MTLHDRIRAVVEERLRIARAVIALGRYSAKISSEHSQELTDALSLHLVANDPADAILSAEHALDVLDRHWPAEDEPGLCRFCFGQDGEDYYPYPCPEIRALATRWRVEVDG